MFRSPSTCALFVFGVHSSTMDSRCRNAHRTLIGQVERDRNGVLWATLYAAPAERAEFVLRRELVRSLRHGKRRVSDMVLGESDAADLLAGAGR